MPRDTWGHLFSGAEREIGVLVYAGLFLSEDAGVQKILKDKASAGVRVRILLGDPDSQVVADRGEDEGVGDAHGGQDPQCAGAVPAAACSWRVWSSGSTGRSCTTRSTAADDQVLVNTHVFGVTAAVAPVWHLRKLPGGELAGLYIDSFERVWETAHAGGWGLAGVARRIDYYDDPSAPEANSLVPSVNVVVTNAAGEVLLIRRSDNDNWAVPGGAIDLGESMVQAAVRETREETGIDCEVTGLVGIYTDPRHVILYTSNGEVRQEFSIVLTARATGGEPTRSEESSEVRWVPRVELGGYSMDRSMRLRIGHYLEGRATPYLG